MKYLIPTLFTFCICLGCQSTEQQSNLEQTSYPEELQKVFDKHGGLERWNSMQSLAFEIVKENGNERHSIQLTDRRDKVEGPGFQMGYDGSAVWLAADTSYKGNAAFYHNLMFYFYAMPFVLADEGIVYSDTEPISYGGKEFPGIKISFEDGVGVSAKDEYLLHYDPETYQMAWLGYTATYFTQKKKSTFNFIQYEDWGTFDGLLLPQTISWFTVEEGKLIEPRNTVQFEQISIRESPFEDLVFAMPDGAKLVE